MSPTGLEGYRGDHVDCVEVVLDDAGGGMLSRGESEQSDGERMEQESSGL